ncbi:Drought responsive protein [Corchorus olitorius]|uniref:Drought responsive protein n=1 Tax=Corchorus olitorius TaxID=93759 RepID=A0A1R3IHN4_9ROSI|nr:Drought responsive protein [Corchorus olitorius]
MEDDSWSFGVSASSRSYQSTLKSLSDLCIDFEEIEEDDELKTEYPCPYCSEDYDLLGLCCHIDEEHHLEANYGIPEADSGQKCLESQLYELSRVLFAFLALFTSIECKVPQHILYLPHFVFRDYSNHKLKFRKGDSYSTLSSLRKELHDAHYQSLLSRSWSSLSSSNSGPDPLLSFLSCVPPADSSESVQSSSSTEVTLEEKGSDENVLEKVVQPSPLSDKEHSEKAKRSEFVQGLLLSTIFDGGL